MVAVFDNKDSVRAEKLKDYLRLTGIPCATFASVSDCGTGAYVNVFFADSVTSLMDDVSQLDRESIVLSDLKSEYDLHGFAYVYNRVTDVLDVKYGINPDSFSAGKYSFSSESSVFYGRIIPMTDTEKLIIKYLVFNSGTMCSMDDILRFCMDTATKHNLSVHISNINNITSSLTGKALISVIRKHGYSIP